MPTSKKSDSNKRQTAAKDFPAQAKEKIHQEIDGLGQLLSTVKTKFDQMDDQTKKKIAMGVAGAAALIAGLVGVRKMSKKCHGKCRK